MKNKLKASYTSTFKDDRDQHSGFFVFILLCISLPSPLYVDAVPLSEEKVPLNNIYLDLNLEFTTGSIFSRLQYKTPCKSLTSLKQWCNKSVSQFVIFSAFLAADSLFYL